MLFAIQNIYFWKQIWNDIRRINYVNDIKSWCLKKKKGFYSVFILRGKSVYNAGLYVINKYSDNEVGLWEADRN